jgi:hypothetical protein
MTPDVGARELISIGNRSSSLNCGHERHRSLPATLSHEGFRLILDRLNRVTLWRGMNRRPCHDTSLRVNPAVGRVRHRRSDSPTKVLLGRTWWYQPAFPRTAKSTGS